MSDTLIPIRVTEDELIAIRDALRDYDPRVCSLTDEDEHVHDGPCDGWSPADLDALRTGRIAVDDSVAASVREDWR